MNVAIRRVVRPFFLCLAILSFFLSSIGVGQEVAADGWSVRRDGSSRRAVLRTRLKQMLEQNPFSNYAFTRLLRLYPSQLLQLHLLQEYEKKSRVNPSKLRLSVIYARLLFLHRDWSGSLSIYQKVLKKRPLWLGARMALAETYAKLKMGKMAVKVFTTLLPKVKGEKREGLLKKYLKVSLLYKQKDAIRQALTLLRKEPWFNGERLIFARLLAKHGAFQMSADLYRALLQSYKGVKRVRLLLEMSRMALKLKRSHDALQTLRMAQKIPSLHNWFTWEMQMLEVSIFRARKELPELLKRLEKKWHNSKNRLRLLLLGRLSSELQQPIRAKGWYERAVKFYPGEKKVRLRLISVLSILGRQDQAIEHIEILIKKKLALGHHYLRVARALVKKAHMPQLLRWQRKWSQKSACEAYVEQVPIAGIFRDVFKRYVYRYRRYAPQFASRSRTRFAKNSRKRWQLRAKCSKKSWDAYRLKRWMVWERYYQVGSYRLYADKIKVLARSFVKQFPKDWDTLSKMERLTSEVGMRKTSAFLRRHLIKATTFDLSELSTLRRLLNDNGELKLFVNKLEKSFQTKWLREDRATQFSAYSLVPYGSDEQSFSDASLLKHHEAWANKMCLLIRPFLKRRMNRVSRFTKKQKPFLILKMGLLLKFCGEQSKRLDEQNRQLLGATLRAYQGPYHLTSFVLDSMLTGAFSNLFSLPIFRFHPKKLDELFRLVLNENTLPVQWHFVLRNLQKLNQNNHMANVLTHLCQQSSKHCKIATPYLNWLLLKKGTKPEFLLKAIRSVAKQKVRTESLLKWALLLKKKYWNQPRALNLLAETRVLFKSADRTLHILHLTIMRRALSIRKRAPLRLALWCQMFGEYLHMIPRYPNKRKKGTKFYPVLVKLDQAEEAAKAFPHLYRGILARTIARYYYQRKRSINKLRSWLLKKPILADMSFLRFLYRFPAGERKIFARKVAVATEDPAALYWLSSFSQKSYDLKLQLYVLRKLRSFQPQNHKLLRQIIDLLDYSQSQTKEAHRLAFVWLKARRKDLSIRYIRKHLGGCCTDSIEQVWAMRLLALGLSIHGWKSLQKDWFRLLPHLSKKQRKELVRLLASFPASHKMNREMIADLAFQHGLSRLVVKWGKHWLLDKKSSVVQLKRLAISYDLMGQIKQGSRAWDLFFQRTKKDDQELFFSDFSKKMRQQGKLGIAFVANYRALIADYSLSKLQAKEKIAALFLKGEAEKARVLWYASLGPESKKCFERKKEAFPFGLHVASTLWKIGLPYHGPLLFFPLCRWSKSEKSMSSYLQPLVKFLKKHAGQKVLLAAGASPDEPDAMFIARQRVMMVRNTLLHLGIPLYRIKLQVRPLRGKCLQKKAKKRELCYAFQRQVALLPFARTQTPKNVGSLSSFSLHLSRDADGDGVLDREDACPFQATKIRIGYGRFRRLRYGRRRRHFMPILSRRVGQMNGVGHPFAKIYPYFKQLKYRKRTRFAKRGCPSFPSLKIRKQPNANVFLLQTTFFSKGYSYPRSHSRKSLHQLIAFMKYYRPSGVLQVEVEVRDKKRRKRGKSSREKLARERARRLKSYLIQYGFPRGRIVSKITFPPFGIPLDARSGTHRPLVLFRLVR